MERPAMAESTLVRGTVMVGEFVGSWVQEERFLVRSGLIDGKRRRREEERRGEGESRIRREARGRRGGEEQVTW
jgi:hypothetical protein